jgi:hypothetical protein
MKIFFDQVCKHDVKAAPNGDDYKKILIAELTGLF